MFCSLFLNGTGDWIFKNVPARRGSHGKEYISNRGVIASVHVRTLGGVGQVFVIMVGRC